MSNKLMTRYISILARYIVPVRAALLHRIMHTSFFFLIDITVHVYLIRNNFSKMYTCNNARRTINAEIESCVV